MKANYGEKEINSILQKVRIFKKEIGSYEIFAITDNFDYAVKLSNGKILIKVEELQYEEEDKLTPEDLATIANRFISSSAQNTNAGEQETRTNPSPKLPPRNTNTHKNRRNILTAIFVSSIVLLGVYFAIPFINNFIEEKNDAGESYHKKVMTIEETERSQPTKFLSSSGTYKENFWGDKFKINCRITNSATVATYKDAVIKVTYYTKTKTVLGSNNFTIYETFPPNSTKTIDIEVESYKNVNSIGWEVINAQAY